jgi:hypothetical protein
MIGRGTYGKVFKAKRKDGWHFQLIYLYSYSFYLCQ